MHIDQRMEPKDRAFQACSWSLQGIQSVRFMHGDWIKHDASLMPSAIQQHQVCISSLPGQSCIYLFIFFFFQHSAISRAYHSEQGLRLCCGNWKLQGCFINIGQQGNNRNNKGKKNLWQIYWSLSPVTHHADIWRQQFLRLARVSLELSAHSALPCKYSCLLWAIVPPKGLEALTRVQLYLINRALQRPTPLTLQEWAVHKWYSPDLWDEAQWFHELNAGVSSLTVGLNGAMWSVFST